MNPFKIVHAGCGGISSAWFQALRGRSDAVIVGLVDLVEEAARSRREEFQLAGAEIGTDLAAMIEATRPDVVFDCTVPQARASVVRMALERGCHVLSEKPMAASLAEARALIDTAGRAGRVFAVMQNRRFDPHLRALRGFLDSGAAGEVTTLNADFYLGAHFGGFRDQMEHVLLLDMAIHSFDQARAILRADPVSVFCHEWNPHGSWYAHGASAIALFEMTGGAVFSYRGSWCAEGLPTSWQCEWRAVGTRGTATWNGEAGFRAQRAVGDTGFIRPQEDLPVPVAVDGNTSGHARCIEDFLAALRDGRAPETIGTDNIKSLAMVFAAIESAQTGHKVTIGI